MANVISFSLFGYDSERAEGCFDFNSYFRYLSLSLRMAALIFPDWMVNVVLDKATYDSKFKYFFDYHAENGKLTFQIVDKQPLCQMMLQRISPAFMEGCDRFICRDLDSLFTYREAQAVQIWINSGRIGSAITDSISHTIDLLGGMIGFQSKEFRERMGVDSFAGLLSLDTNIDFSVKGSDQVFLHQRVLPKVQDSLVEHFILGMKQSFRGMCYNYIEDIPLDIPIELKESNTLVSHIGTAGYAIEPTLIFFDKYMTKEQKLYYNKIERQYKDIFYWHL